MAYNQENTEPSTKVSEPVAAYNTTNSHRSCGSARRDVHKQQNIQFDEEELNQLRIILAKSEADFVAGRVYTHQEVKEMLNNYQYGNSLV